MRIFLAPGHGGNDPGAVGPTGLRESDVALDLAKGLAVLLQAAGHTVSMSRTSDSYVSPEGQARLANMANAEAVVAIHCNAAASREAHGIEAWTTKGQTKADPLADCILVEYVRGMPNVSVRRDLTDGDGDKESNFAVLRLSLAPAVLVETGFISHPETEAIMRTGSWRRMTEIVLLRGIQSWIKERNA